MTEQESKVTEQESRMLYKKDGPHRLDGRMVHYRIFEPGEIRKARAEGWADTPRGAYEGKKK